MIAEFRLPDLGEGLPEAEIVQWLVAPGDFVALNQTIAEVETAKAIVELPSPHAGTVTALHAEAGDTVEVGAALIEFDIGGESDVPVAPDTSHAAETSDDSGDDSAGDAEDAKPQPNLVGYGAAPASKGRPQRRARRGASGIAVAVDQDSDTSESAPHDAIAATETVERPTERPRSTPPVRKFAKDNGVELGLITGTGADGLITRADVEAHAARFGIDTAATEESAIPLDVPGNAESLAPDSLVGRGPRERRIPIRGVRKFTAEAMVRSAFTAPHVTTFLTVDVTATSDLLASLKADRSLEGHRIGILAVAAKAVCLSLARMPSLNSRWDAPAGEIVEPAYVNLGIAAATARGLVVPNIRDADTLTLVEMADAIGALAEKARAGKTSPAEMSGGTFSITNIGVFGVDAGTPILNPGEAGILGLGAVRRMPWEHRGEIALRDVMTLSLSFDHRLVDGEQGARFLADVGSLLREPGRAMLMR